MVARRKKTVSPNEALAKARRAVLRLRKQVSDTVVEALRLDQEIAAVVDQQRLVLEKEAADRAAAARRESEETPLVTQPVSIRRLLEIASKTKSRGDQVRGVKSVPLRDGGVGVVGYILDQDRRRVPLRGYEIWKDGSRYFYWTLKKVVDEFKPEVVYETHYTGPRPPDEHMVVSWEEERQAERRKRKKDREDQKAKRRAERRAVILRNLARRRRRLTREREAAQELLEKLERKLKKAEEKLERLQREERERVEPKPKKAKPKSKAKTKAKSKPKAKPKPKVKAKAKPKSKKPLTAAQKLSRARSLAAKQGWETRRRNARTRSKRRRT